MDDYLTKYGENGKFNQTNLKRIDAAMDRFVEYDPRIGTKLSYIMHRWVRGIAQTGENILDTLELWKLSNATTQVVVDETSGAVRATDEIQAKKEKILGDDKYDRMRAKDGARFNLSSKEQRVGEVAEAIGKGTPAGVLAMIPGVGPIISALVTWGSTAGANAKQMWKEGEGEVSADKAIGYGTLSGAIEGAVNYFGNRLFDAGTLKGAGNRVVAQMAETSGGQALLNTFGATITDTGMELFTTILKDEIKTWYNPKAEKMSEEELQKMVYASLVANLVINGMQNFVAYQRGLVAETGPSEAEERAMMRSMAGEELEAEVPRSRPQAEEAEMMGTMEENIRGRAEAEASGRQALEGGANEPLMLPKGRTEGQKLLPEPEQKKLLPAGDVDEQELIDTLMDNTGQKVPAGIDAEIPKGNKAGEAPQIEGAKDRTAEEIAGAIAQESGIPITTQAAQPGVTTSAGVSSGDIIAKKEVEQLQYKPATEDIRVKLEKAGLSQEKGQEIITLPKAEKPLPETYLSETYIEEHLKVFKESGAVKILPTEPRGTIGGKGGIFVLSERELQDIIKSSNGDIEYIEKALGMDLGYLGENPVIVRFNSNLNIRMPQGSELGADPKYWMSGGYTSGGIMEAVIDPVDPSNYIVSNIFE